MSFLSDLIKTAKQDTQLLAQFANKHTHVPPQAPPQSPESGPNAYRRLVGSGENNTAARPLSVSPASHFDLPAMRNAFYPRPAYGPQRFLHSPADEQLSSSQIIQPLSFNNGQSGINSNFFLPNGQRIDDEYSASQVLQPTRYNNGQVTLNGQFYQGDSDPLQRFRFGIR